MADMELTVVLKLLDQASSGIRQALGQTTKATNDLKNKSAEAGKTIRQQFKDASSSVRDFRRTLFFVTAAMAAVIASTKEAAEYTEDVKKSFDEFTVATKQLAVMLGQVLEPALKIITGALKLIKDTTEAAIAGFLKITGFLDGIFRHFNDMPAANAFKYAMDEANAAADVFLDKIEVVGAKVGAGQTLAVVKEQQQNIKKIRENIKGARLEIQDFNDFLTNEFSSAFDGMTTTLSGFFQDIFVGELKSAKEYFADFGRSLINMMANIMAQWLMMKIAMGIFGGSFVTATSRIAGKAGGSFVQFHKGGVVRAHDGLAVDEVPIIAQTGERVLSRKQNKEYEKGMGGVTININQVVQAWDASDVYRNRKMLSASIAEEIKNNAGIRQVIRSYT